MISQRAWCTAVLRKTPAKWALMCFDRGWKEIWGLHAQNQAHFRNNIEFKMFDQSKSNWYNLHGWGSFTFGLCTGRGVPLPLSWQSSPKGQHAHLSPHAADCTGDAMAPRGALMPLVIICNTRLSLEARKQQPEHSREQQGHELISQPSGAGKWCRHHPLVLEPDWSKEPHMQMVF